MYAPDPLTTPELIKLIEGALRYEHGNELEIAKGHDWGSRVFLPAAKVAYERILGILGKPSLAKTDLDVVHAEMLGVFEQPNYSGIQLFFSCVWVDQWLSSMEPEGQSRPSLADFYRTYVRRRAEQRMRDERLRDLEG